MNTQWVCASCRRRLWRLRANGGCSTKSASFTSFSRTTPRPPQELHLHQGSQPQSSRPRQLPRRDLPFQFDYTVEEDFIARITAGRDPDSAPYSRPYRRHATKPTIDDEQADTATRATVEDQANAVQASAGGSSSVSLDNPGLRGSQVWPDQLHRSPDPESVTPGSGARQSHVPFKSPTLFSDSKQTFPRQDRLESPEHQSVPQTTPTPPSIVRFVEPAASIATNSPPIRKHVQNLGPLIETQARQNAILSHQARRESEPAKDEERQTANAVQIETAQAASPNEMSKEQAAFRFAASKSTRQPLERVSPERVPTQNSKQSQVSPQAASTKETPTERGNFRRAKSKYIRGPLTRHSSEREPTPNCIESQVSPHDQLRTIMWRWSHAEQQTPNLSPSEALEHFGKKDWPGTNAEALQVLIQLCLHSFHRDEPARCRSRREMNREILAVWKLLFRRCGEYMTKGNQGVLQQVQGSDDFQAYLQSEQMRLIQVSDVHTFREQLHSFLPLGPDVLSSNNFGLEAIAMMSHTLARDAVADASGHPTTSLSRSSPDADLEIFVEFLGTLMRHSTLLQLQTRRLNTLRRGGLDADALRRIAQSVGATINGPSNGNEPGEVQPELNKAEQLMPLYKARLSRATEQRRLSLIDETWADIKQTFQNHDEAMEIPLGLFEPVINAYMSLRRPLKAVEVWNTMSSQGTKPNLSHWDSMLRGFGNCRDVQAVHSLWANMLQAGVQPDERLWATRIRAIATYSTNDAALRAFETMADEWREANSSNSRPSTKAGGPVSIDVPKPSTQCLNSVVSSLAKLGKQAELSRAFAVAKELEIPLDVYTFNPLFKAAYEEGNTQTATLLLERMKKLNIEPDVATFTIQLGAIFRNLQQDEGYILGDEELKMVLQEGPSESGNGEEQLAVKTLFDLMASAGIDPTPHTYATLVRGLLEQDPPSVRAAYATVRHIADNDLPLSPQIYSMLIKIHFNQDPPDLASVEALWHHAQRYRIARRKARYPLILDTIFYDRFIEGWSRVGNTQQAMHVYSNAQEQGVRHGWQAMRELVARLLYEGNRNAAQGIANAASKREEGDSQYHAQSFWRLCEQGGLTVPRKPDSYE